MSLGLTESRNSFVGIFEDCDHHATASLTFTKNSILATMQKKEVDEQLKSLQTAIAEKQPSQNVVTILKKLQLELVPTEELLRVRPS